EPPTGPSSAEQVGARSSRPREHAVGAEASTQRGGRHGRDSRRGERMIAVAPNREQTLEAVRRISIYGRGRPTSSALLENVCTVVSETLEFDSVVAVRYDGETEDAGPASGSIVCLLGEARDTQEIVFLELGNLTSAFALPLISGERCLAFLCGTRTARSAP